jgi:hypothetical protein
MDNESEAKGRKASIWQKTYSISLEQIVVILILVSVFMVFFVNIQVHANWDLMREEASQYGVWMNLGSSFLQPYLQNNTFTSNNSTNQLVSEHLMSAQGCLEELAATDPQHSQQLFAVQNFLFNIAHSETDMLNDTSRTILLNDLESLAIAIPNAYHNSGDWSSANTDNGAPPFWYFGTDPCNETVLQNAVSLANQGNSILKSLPSLP